MRPIDGDKLIAKIKAVPSILQTEESIYAYENVMEGILSGRYDLGTCVTCSYLYFDDSWNKERCGLSGLLL